MMNEFMKYKVGEYYFDPLSQKVVVIMSNTAIGTDENVVHIRFYESGEFKTARLYQEAKLIKLTKWQKILKRVVTPTNI